MQEGPFIQVGQHDFDWKSQEQSKTASSAKKLLLLEQDRRAQLVAMGRTGHKIEGDP